MLYSLTIRNLPYRQAQAMYRFLVNLADVEGMHGNDGMSWSGVIPGPDRSGGDGNERIVTITPQKS